MIKHVGAAGLERLELQRLRDRVGRLFAALQEAMEADAPLASTTWSPPVDICESETEIHIRFELPGISEDEVQMGVTNTHLCASCGSKHPVLRTRSSCDLYCYQS